MSGDSGEVKHNTQQPRAPRGAASDLKQWVRSFLQRILRINPVTLHTLRLALRSLIGTSQRCAKPTLCRHIVVSHRSNAFSIGFRGSASPAPSWWGTEWDRDRDPVLSALSLVAAADQTSHHTLISAAGDPGVIVDLLDEVLYMHVDTTIYTFLLTWKSFNQRV